MRHKNDLFRVLVALAIMALGAGEANALYTTTLNNSNANNFNPNPDPAGFATVAIDDSVANILSFAVTINPLGQIPSQLIEEFGFNTNGNDLTAAGVTVSLPSGWTLETSPTLDGFGTFNFGIKTTGSIGNNPLNFSIAYTGINILDYNTIFNNKNQLFAAKVSSGNTQGGQGAFIAGGTSGSNFCVEHPLDPSCTSPNPIPEPSPLWLLGVGLLGWTGYARRYGKSAFQA